MLADDLLQGWVEPGYEAVADAFRANFTERGDAGGAALAVRVDGRPVVDIWGGMADRAAGRTWRHDTIAPVFSGSKGMAAMCLLVLADRGRLDPEAAVAEFWPEFGQRGKGAVLVRHVLGHTAGVPGIRRPLTLDDLLDDRAMAAAVAAEPPWWPPGEVLCYHALTFGWIAGELVRRIDGRSIGAFFRDEIAGPLEIDAWIGIPPHEADRVAVLHHGPDWDGRGPYPDSARGAEHLAAIVDNPSGRHGEPIPWNSPELQRAEVPAINGIAAARGLARMYDLLIREGGGRHAALLSPDAARRASVPTSSGREWVTGREWRMGFGFQLHDLAPPGSAIAAVGHAGAGGSVHGAWPQEGTSFSFVVNELRAGARDRAAAVLAAIARCRSSHPR